jgi:hypothetical protein
VTITHHDHRLRTTMVCATCGEGVRRADVRRTFNLDGWDLAGPT